ncbi:TIGR04024 family LLM class F420-dependent oxidoreductase [Halobacteriales archaeon Cl-PHB]
MTPPVAVDVSLPESLESLADIVALGQAAEDRGYETAWLSETWGRDVVTTATMLSERTDDLGVGTSIMPIYSRSPSLIGQTAATLQEATDGRFRLGLGPSGPAVVQYWHGEEYGNPLRHLRENVEIVSQVLSGEPLDYEGEHHEVANFALRSDAPEPGPPVEVAGMGPKAVELAGRFADGWHGTFLTREGFKDRLEALERGADLGDRDAADVTTTLVLTCAALEDGDAARDAVRQDVAVFIGAMGTFFRDTVAGQGYEDAAHEIHDAWQEGKQGEAIGAVPAELLDDLVVAGTPEEARSQFEAFAATDGLDAIAVQFPQNFDDDQRQETLDALAPGQFD